MEKDILANPKNVKFIDLLQICIKYFGDPRISGSHHIFRMPGTFGSLAGRSKNKYTKRWKYGKGISNKSSCKGD
jgi:hypothetical protein